MAKKKEDEIEAAAAPINPATRKRSRRTGGGDSTAAPGGATMCDDVLRSIFARVPTRTAVASMALSKHHRRLMRCPDFIALHCRLGPPLPSPHVAYVATTKVRRGSGAGGPAVSGYHGFHVAAAGGGGSNAPMRPLAGPMYLEKRYVNTCKGVMLLAGKPRPATCVLWNPAVADEEREVTVPVSARNDCAILGLGYGSRSKTYKLLLTRRRKREDALDSDPLIARLPRELLVYALGGAGEQPRLRTLLSEGLDGGISGKSLYIDGTIYLLHDQLEKPAILAYDVDDETVTTIDLPGDGDPWRCHAMSALLVMSGRPCVDLQDRHDRSLWLLTVDHQWEKRWIIEVPIYGHHRNAYSIAGVWDCGGMLVMYAICDRADGEDDKLLLYCTETKKMTEANLPFSVTLEGSEDYALCWGYKPTLVSPGSIVGELNRDEERRRDRTADIMAALKPANERDRRKGQKATLNTVCFMEFLLRTMQKLPENMQDVIEMPLLRSEDSDSSSKNELYHSDSGSGSSLKNEFYHSDSDLDSDFVDHYHSGSGSDSDFVVDDFEPL